MADTGSTDRRVTVDFTGKDARGARVGPDLKDGEGIVLGREQIQEILKAAKANGINAEAPPKKEINIDLKTAEAKAWSKGLPTTGYQPQPSGSGMSSNVQRSSRQLSLSSPSALQMMPLLTLLLLAAAAIYVWATRQHTTTATSPKGGSSAANKKKAARKASAKAGKAD